jgi:hypothetical protein
MTPIVVQGIVRVTSGVFDFMGSLRRFQTSDISQRRVFDMWGILYISLASARFADFDAGC